MSLTEWRQCEQNTKICFGVAHGLTAASIHVLALLLPALSSREVFYSASTLSNCNILGR